MKFSGRTSLILLILLSVVGAVYLGRSILGMDPTKQSTRFQVMIPSSGGLLEDSPVLINGKLAGRIHVIDVVPGGLRVTGEYEAKYRVSKKSMVVIANLSVAGEQYLNFMQPPNNDAPYFKDGDVISDPRQIHVSATVGDALSKASYISGQLDPEVLDDVATTVDQIFQGLDPELEELRELINQNARLFDDQGDKIGRIFANLQTTLDLLRRLAPQLPAIGESLKGFDGPVVSVLEAFNRLRTLTPTKQQAVERLVAVLDRHLTDILTDSHPLLLALKPISAYFRTTYFDPASTMDTLLKMLPQDGVPRVVLNMAG